MPAKRVFEKLIVKESTGYNREGSGLNSGQSHEGPKYAASVASHILYFLQI